VWGEHEVGLTHVDRKRIVVADLGVLELWCQNLFDPEQEQVLIVFTAAPGSPSYEKLQLLGAVA